MLGKDSAGGRYGRVGMGGMTDVLIEYNHNGKVLAWIKGYGKYRNLWYGVRECCIMHNVGGLVSGVKKEWVSEWAGGGYAEC